MSRRGAPLLLGLLLASAAAWCQEPSPLASPAAKHHRARGGGASSRSDAGGAPQMKELPCPKGFTAQIDSGPHLKLEAAAPSKKNRKSRKNADSETSPTRTRTPKQVLARRCVADPPKKASLSPARREAAAAAAASLTSPKTP